jgi:hypothetical protein
MLTYPFFWRENHKFFTDVIENSDFIFTIFESKVIRRKIEFLHDVKVEKEIPKLKTQIPI